MSFVALRIRSRRPSSAGGRGSMELFLVAMAMLLTGAVASIVATRAPKIATVCGVAGAVGGCLTGLAPTLRVLAGGDRLESRFGWDAAHGLIRLEIDPLGAFFLAPVFVLGAIAAIYGGEYLFAYRHEKRLGAPWFFYNLFLAGMATVVAARTAVVFLTAWEIMSIAAFFLVTFEHEKPETRRAGWVYLVAAHLGVACLIGMFMLLGSRSGSFESAWEGLDFSALARTAANPPYATLIFLLAIAGFGAKAGFVPFHVWLPEAHPAAPSHVSALMSGVMIKLGIYGLLRILTMLGDPALWWGPALATLGVAGATAGVALAIEQRDIKRVLAYSSMENIGLITTALGVALWGAAARLPLVAAVATTAVFVHIWNHAIMKGLMFLAAGSALHGSGTKDLEKLGGLLKRMPLTGGLMIVGGVAMAALPPLNGFIGKWLIYVSLFRGGIAVAGTRGSIALLAAGALALIGGLAAIAFVRLLGIALLGSPRSEAAAHAHESPLAMTVPLAVLAVLCVIAAILPAQIVQTIAPAIDQARGIAAGQTAIEIAKAGAAPASLGYFNFCAIVLFLGGFAATIVILRVRGIARGSTWGCGYARPTSRMSYTASSFAELPADHATPRFFRPKESRRGFEGPFPAADEYASSVPDPISERLYEPFFSSWADRFARFRILQQGNIHIYLLYILIVVTAALAWVSTRIPRGGS